MLVGLLAALKVVCLASCAVDLKAALTVNVLVHCLDLNEAVV